MRFAEKLERGWKVSGAMLCVGLDPVIARMPAELRHSARPVLAFNRLVVDAVGDLVCAFKPQFAHHAAQAAEPDLAETIAYIRASAPHAVIILDAKRGDIGSTAEMYAREAFERYDADAVTVNPFMGEDTLAPFIERPDRGAVVLCRTSNPGAAWIQGLDVGGEPLFVAIARRASERWSGLGNVMLVAGATAPADLLRVRGAAPDLALLTPGIGEQGGSPEAVVKAGARADGRGIVASASRSVIYAGDRDQIRAAALGLWSGLSLSPAGGAPTPRPSAAGHLGVTTGTDLLA